MFLLIEGNILINLALMSKIELVDRERSAKLYNAGVYEADSKIVYEYVKNPLNAGFVMAPANQVVPNPLPPQEAE
jgi:hypothetical protein